MIKPVATINVVPNLPDPLKRMSELAYNMRWAWDQETIGAVPTSGPGPLACHRT